MATVTAGKHHGVTAVPCQTLDGSAITEGKGSERGNLSYLMRGESPVLSGLWLIFWHANGKEDQDHLWKSRLYSTIEGTVPLMVQCYIWKYYCSLPLYSVPPRGYTILSQGTSGPLTDINVCGGTLVPFRGYCCRNLQFC